MRPANERRRYIVTSSLIGWPHTQRIPACKVSFMHELICQWSSVSGEPVKRCWLITFLDLFTVSPHSPYGRRRAVPVAVSSLSRNDEIQNDMKCFASHAWYMTFLTLPVDFTLTLTTNLMSGSPVRNINISATRLLFILFSHIPQKLFTLFGCCFVLLRFAACQFSHNCYGKWYFTSTGAFILLTTFTLCSNSLYSMP